MHRPSKRTVKAHAPARFSPDSVSVEVGRRIAARGHQALMLLLDSVCYSSDLGCEPWDFAVQITELKSTGLNGNDIRWLVGRDFLQHRVETTQAGAATRQFRTDSRARYVKRSSFVLTEAGVGFIQVLLSETESTRLSRLKQNKNGAVWDNSTSIALPNWDSDRQELCLGEVIVKRFKVPARNQETVLTVFQEEGWPVRIDDPLPQMVDINPKRRLHDTINALNRNQKAQLIRFRGDGQAQGIRWEFVMKPRLTGRRRHTA